MSSNAITAVTLPDEPGPRDVIVRNTDNQEAIFTEGFTYNPFPTITRIDPNYGRSTGGARMAIEGTGFLQGARVMIGDRAATTMVRDDVSIEAVAPPIPRGKWDVKVINPDTQEAVVPEGFMSLLEFVYNYPNPFSMTKGTTFRYVTHETVQSMVVKIFNLAGKPIDIVQQENSREVHWQNDQVRVGLYVYTMEVEMEDGGKRGFRGTLEVYE